MDRWACVSVPALPLQIVRVPVSWLLVATSIPLITIKLLPHCCRNACRFTAEKNLRSPAGSV